MHRKPQAGEHYQVCPHLAAESGRTDRHYWRVPGRDPWLVLCDACHASFSERRSVEIHGELFTLAADVPIAPDSSCIHHSAPGDVIADEPPPAPQPPPNIPTGQSADRRPNENAPPWLPIADRIASVASELLQSFQAQAQSRAEVELRRLELETQAMERMIRALDASIVTLDRLQALFTEREAAIVAMIARVVTLVAQLPPRESPPSNGAKPTGSRLG